MLKENKGHIIATIIAFIGFIILALVFNSERFSYALDYEINVLTADCTYAKYIQDRDNCIKPEYK